LKRIEICTGAYLMGRRARVATATAGIYDYKQVAKLMQAQSVAHRINSKEWVQGPSVEE
jgi:hypothetical protein